MALIIMIVKNSKNKKWTIKKWSRKKKVLTLIKVKVFLPHMS